MIGLSLLLLVALVAAVLGGWSVGGTWRLRLLVGALILAAVVLVWLPSRLL